MTVVYARLNQALAGCEETLSMSGDWYNACTRVSNILISMGRFDEASQWNAMAIDKTPNLVQFHAKAAFLYVIQEKWDEAINWYKQLLTIDPQYTEAHRRLAQIYSRLGKLEDEIVHWYEFLTQKPEMGSPEGHYKLAQTFQEQGKLEWAASCYERSIALNGQYWLAYYDLAELRIRQKRWDAAADCYQRLLEQDSTQVDAHYKLGRAWLQQKNYDRAIAKFKETNQLAPKFSPAYAAMVQTLMELERWDEAISTCRSIISFVEDFPWAYRDMGRAFMQKGEDLKAIACYQKGCQLQGWNECQQHDYQFTDDRFIDQIPLWHEHLQFLAGAEGLTALEIGSQQGMATCWLLDTILTHASAELFCIAPIFSMAFDRNINQTDALDKIVCFEGKPLSMLADLPTAAFDLITIQGRDQKASDIQHQVRLCWSLLKQGGIMIIRDYGWTHPGGPRQSPKVGTDRFLRSIQGKFDSLVQTDQFIMRKNVTP